MYVNELEIGSIQEQVIAQPSWNAVETSIRNLDGGLCDAVFLNGTNNSYMSISGGENGRYVIGGYLCGCGSFICASGEVQGPEKDVVVAGDYNTYPSRNVVEIAIAIAAARAFFDRGVLAENLGSPPKPLILV